MKTPILNHEEIKTSQDLKKVKEEIKQYGRGNVALRFGYGFTDSDILLTFNGWKEQGYKVKKGEKAYTFFSKPITIKRKEGEEEVKKSYFGTAKCFHSSQVEKIKK